MEPDVTLLHSVGVDNGRAGQTDRQTSDIIHRCLLRLSFMPPVLLHGR